MRFARRHRKAIIAVVGIEIMLYCFGCATADKLLLFPTTGRVDPGMAVARAVPFEGGQIEVFVARSPACAAAPPRAMVLNFTGNAGRAEHAIGMDGAYWVRHPVEIWAVNHPGFGQSTPPATLRRFGPAALAVYDAAASASPGTPIFVHGTSLGTAMALHLAANRPVAGVVLRTPPPLRNLILRRHGWWNLWLLAGPVASGVPSELNALSTAPQVKSPGLFLLMESDSVVPVQYQNKVVDAFSGPKRVVSMPGGDHNDMLDSATAKDFERGIDWLWTTAFPR